MTRTFIRLASILLLTFAGCSDDGAPTTPMQVVETPTPVPVRNRPTEVELVAWMEAHYGAVVLAHDALLQGDLATLRAQLAQAATLASPAAMPDAWKPLVEHFKSASGAASDVETLDAGADGLASVVFSCGQCHAALGTGPVYPAPAPDDGVNEIQAAMFDHEWATERLWEGVTGPWDNAWDRGADVLAETRVFGDALGELEGDLLQRELALRALGEEARRTTNHRARAAIYGRLLATCGDCHRAAGITFDG